MLQAAERARDAALERFHLNGSREQPQQAAGESTADRVMEMAALRVEEADRKVTDALQIAGLLRPRPSS